jgi:hypothetical protein
MKFTTGATIDPEARYLDPERVIRELEESERDHELDAGGVIEKLKEAVATCQSAVDRYTARAAESEHAAYAYAIARGKYLTEIKRRVELPSGRSVGQKTPERPGWLNWCRENGVGIAYAHQCIAAGAGDLTKIKNKRRYDREYKRQRRSRSPLEKIKELWIDVPPAEREMFIKWAIGQKDYGPFRKQQLMNDRQESVAAQMDAG